MNAQGTVYLIGAGPGDPGLLTVKAANLIQQADIVIHDRLISTDILSLINAQCARIYAGKRTNQHTIDQCDINQLLVEASSNYTTVVRLKGGDPFIFGRGGEEALALASAGVPFEIVPGITSAQACAAYAGIPLTHRGVARGVQFVTGHWMNNSPLQISASTIADDSQTLVVYMGLENVEAIIDSLLAVGRDPHTPVAIVENGTTDQHRKIITTINSLSAAIETDQIRSPAILIIGAVVELAEHLEWFVPTVSQMTAKAEPAARYITPVTGCHARQSSAWVGNPARVIYADA